MKTIKRMGWPAILLLGTASLAWATGEQAVAGGLQTASQETAAATSELGKGNLEGASASSAKVFDLLTRATQSTSDTAVAGGETSSSLRLLNHEGQEGAPKAEVPQPATPGGKEGGIQGVGREVGQFVGGIFGSLTGWYLGGAVGSSLGQQLAEMIALGTAKGMAESGNILGAYGTYYGAAMAGGFLGSVFGTVGGYVVGAVAGSAAGSHIGKWFDRKKKS